MIKKEQDQRKEMVIEYFEQVPIQKYAAEYAGVHEDTVTNWKKEDSDFSDRLLQARARFLRKKLKKAKPEFSAERLFPELRERKEIEHSGNVTVLSNVPEEE